MKLLFVSSIAKDSRWTGWGWCEPSQRMWDMSWCSWKSPPTWCSWSWPLWKSKVFFFLFFFWGGERIVVFLCYYYNFEMFFEIWKANQTPNPTHYWKSEQSIEVCQHLKDELWPRLLQSKVECLTLVAYLGKFCGSSIGKAFCLKQLDRPVTSRCQSLAAGLGECRSQKLYIFTNKTQLCSHPKFAM